MLAAGIGKVALRAGRGLLACALLFAPATRPILAKEPAAASSRAVRQGIAVELQAAPVAGGAAVREAEDARFRFRISDVATGTPVTGVYPSAWIEAVKDGEDPAAGCTARVKELLGGGLFERPAADLNVFYVLTLNADSSISVVDPLFGFGGTQLLAMVRLDSPGEDWVLSAGGGQLFVSMPDSGRVAVVETGSWKVVARVDTGGRPARLALQRDGAYLWATTDSGAVAIRTADFTVAARIATGRGPHDLALTDDDRFTLVTNRGERTLSVVDVAKLARAGDVPLGAAPSSLAFSPLAKAAFVASEDDGVILAVDAERREVRARMQAQAGLGPVRMAPGGRLGLVPNPKANRVYVFDAASNRIVQTAEIDGGPDQITFSEFLAYVRRRESEVVFMLPLEGLGEEGKSVHVVDFPGGRNPLGRVSRPSPADSIVRAPGALAVLVANPADQAVFYYQEGMAAPMGSFSNYGREPRAVLVVDRSLRPQAPGTYETVARVPRSGRYRVAFFLDAPRLVQCFELAVAPSPEIEEQRRRERPARVEPLLADAPVRAGETVYLRFRVTDPNTGRPLAGLQDVNVMTYRSPGTWQQRRWARDAGEGIYETEVVLPEAGYYRVVVECRSQRLLFHQFPPVGLQAVAASGARGAPR
ncbi:MAG TPA: cytochrome D1 [Thermoanaerobaculia bacterium]|nr:cytochrome D1 [Thermoanaerobaculia bacterium]